MTRGTVSAELASQDLVSHWGERNWNPCIVRFRDKLLVSYNYERRVQNPGGRRRIRLAELSENLEPISERDLNLRSRFRMNEDMRLFVHKGNLCGVYFEGTVHDRGAGLVVVAFDEALNVIETFEPRFGDSRQLEKNWQFFSHEGEMLCIYSIRPHVVLHKQGNRMVRVARTDWAGSLPNRIYGGTPPIEFDGEYLSFFHSWRPWPERGVSSFRFRLHPLFSAAHSVLGWPMRGAGTWPHRIYEAGAYTFDKVWPFRVRRYTPEPLLSANTEDAAADRPACVFPCGACWHDGEIILSYGYHDERCRVVSYSAQMLKEKLVAIT
jgi:hypothetical protein